MSRSATFGVLAYALVAVVLPQYASAQVQVRAEPGATPCGTVTPVAGHGVEGGCHVEFVSTEPVSLVAFIPSRVVLSNCDWHFEARVGSNGEGWVTAARLENISPTPPPPGCTRVPCEEATTQMIPWPIHIVEVGPGAERVELSVCLATSLGVGAQCEVHLELDQLLPHRYELGHHPSFEACEVSPAPPAVVGFEDMHFTEELDSERVEILH